MSNSGGPLVDEMRPKLFKRIREKSGLILRWILGLIFVWAGTVKILNPEDFLVSLYGFEVALPEFVLRLTTVVLPWVELLCGLAVLFGIWIESVLLLLSSLLVVFILATGQAWARGLEISCGCFGTSLEETTFLGSVSFAFFRAIVLLIVALYLWFGSRQDPAVS